MTTRARRLAKPHQARTIIAKPGDDTQALVSLIHDCISSGVQRRALLVRLSKLPPDLVGPAQLRLIRQALAPLIMADHGRLFEPDNADMTVVWRGEEAQALNTTLDTLHQMFAGRTKRAHDLTTVLNLPRDAAILLQSVERRASQDDDEAEAEALPPINPAELAALERALAQADVERFVRRRAVWHVLQDGSAELRWEERYLSVDELGASLTPDRDPRGDTWLFRRLTRMLDRRMLSLLTKSGAMNTAGPFALNMNVTSILSAEFLRFDAAVPPPLRGRLLLDLCPADIMADLSSFVFARDFAHARGYRCGLDDAGEPMTTVLPLDPLGLDLRRLHWSQELAASDMAALDAIAGNAARVVLYGTDGSEALAWGLSRGIQLFQGRVLDRRYT